MKDAAVIGGGPAGAATAARLAEGGARVVLIERQPGRQSVCGEFVSANAAARLRDLGLDPERLGALPLHRLRLTAGRRETVMPLPAPAWSLPRDLLDDALRQAAVSRGAVLLRATATRLDGGRVTLTEGEVAAGTAVIATGKHDLRGHPRTGKGRLGFKQYWRLTADQARRLDDAVELHLFRGGYAGLQPVAGGLANLCLTVTPKLFRSSGDWHGLLAHLAKAAPRLAERLRDASPAWPRPLAAAGLPYGFMAPAGTIHRVGDQLAVIHSLAGEGIAMALESGRLTAERILVGQPPESARGYATAIRTGQALAELATRLPTAAVLPPPIAIGWAIRASSAAFARRKH